MGHDFGRGLGGAPGAVRGLCSAVQWRRAGQALPWVGGNQGGLSRRVRVHRAGFHTARALEERDAPGIKVYKSIVYFIRLFFLIVTHTQAPPGG